MPIVEFDGPPSWSLDARLGGVQNAPLRTHGKIRDCEQSNLGCILVKLLLDNNQFII